MIIFLKKTGKNILKIVARYFSIIYFSFPRRIQCNICGWEGRQFLNDKWHKNIQCPNCGLVIRHRLLISALQNLEEVSFKRIVDKKTILHFAPEKKIATLFRERAKKYISADYYLQDCDLKLDICNMHEIHNEQFDVVLAFDVLEHVADYKLALSEIHRVLSENGYAIITIPQPDSLPKTYENTEVVTPEERIRHFGHPNHVRLFGMDFVRIVEEFGFSVMTIDEYNFSNIFQIKHVLFPPQLSVNPFATNYRKVYFCKKL